MGAVAALATLLLSACSTFGTVLDDEVLRIDGHGFTRGDLEQELKARQQSGAAAAKGTYSAEATSAVLNEVIVGEAIKRLAAKHKYAPAKVTPEEVERNLAGTYSSKIADLPKPVRTRAVAQYALIRGLLDGATKDVGDPAAYFAAHKAEFAGEACVAHILVKTQPEAVAVKARLDKGDDFASIAKALSIDPGSGANGGELGCGDPAQFVQEFADAVRVLPIGEVSDPVQTQFGFHLIRVSKRTEPNPADSAVQARISQALESEAIAKLQAELPSMVQDAHITLNPRYGTLLHTKGRPPQVLSRTERAALGSAAG